MRETTNRSWKRRRRPVAVLRLSLPTPAPNSRASQAPVAVALYPTCRAGFNILCVTRSRRSERKRRLPADFTAPSSHFGRNWLWRAASASSFVSAAAVIGILGLSLLQSPLRPHLLTPTHAGGTAAQAATAMPREVGTDPVNITAPLTTRAPADGVQPAAPKTYPSESSALPPVHSAKPPESASLKTSEPQLPLPETAPPNASPSERIRPVRNRLRHAERREGAAVGGRRVNRQEVVAGRPRRGR